MKENFQNPALLMDAPAFGPRQSQELLDWFEASFLGVKRPPEMLVLVDVMEGYGQMQKGKSVIATPIKIGAKAFERGLGVHAVSEVLVRLPGKAKRFRAQAGIDSNSQNNGRGRAVFAVKADGAELFRSGVCRCGDEPVPVDAKLDGATEFTLRVLDAGDGVAWAHSDWADAKIILEDGRELHLDEGKEQRLNGGTFPCSFLLGGASSRELLPNWRRSLKEKAEEDGRRLYVLTYSDLESGMELRCEATCFKRHPAVEWVLHLKNAGKADSPLVEELRPLELPLCVGNADAILRHSCGSSCSETDFLPLEDKLKPPNAQLSIVPQGGRSSNGALPFFNLEWKGQGLAGAIGWSGQWELRACREDGSLRLKAGQQTTHFKLRPGEDIRTPRIALLHWEGASWIGGCNLFRRLVLDHYAPRVGGKIPIPPAAANTWFSFNQGNDATEENQKAVMPSMAQAGVEAYWLDAGWFEGGWPEGTGSWVPKKDAFPNGLKPLGDEAHKLGMKFVLWFEPERVTPISRIFKERPEWVMRPDPGLKPGNGLAAGGLFRLGDPEACKWLTGYLSECVSAWGVDVLRIDFNTDPLPFWTENDEPDRRGMSEIRYIENLYKMWDELRARHPDLAIDNCASGGRRIDIETISRSYPLWQSDTQCCGQEKPVWNQVQNAGLSLYVPLHSGGVWDFDPYSFRSMATTGCNLCRDISKDRSLMLAARKMLDEMKSLRHLLLGDYYPLTSISLDDTAWCGWQYDRPDIGEGFAMLFRREDSPFTEACVPLHSLEPSADYQIRRSMNGKPAGMSGKTLLNGLKVGIPKRPGCALIRYRKMVG